MKLISNSMSAKWKLSFVASVAWLAAMWIDGFFSYSTMVDDDSLVAGIVPISIWFAARWLAIGNQGTKAEQ